MVLPNLLHPVSCVIQQINKAGTAYDHDAREPIQAAARSVAVTKPGQVKWVGQDLRMRNEGMTEDERGYVLFRYIDLGVTVLQIGDRIASMGSTVSEVYITRLQPMGHYTDQGGPALVKAWFTDRLPSKER